MISLTTQQLLDYRFHITELETEKSTIRLYLKTLLITLWDEADGFSGKRPLGNSDWQYQLAADMIDADLLEGNTEYDVKFNWDDFDQMIKDCVYAL